MVHAQEFIQKRAIANFAAADRDYGSRIQRKIDALKAAAARGESISQSGRPLYAVTPDVCLTDLSSQSTGSAGHKKPMPAPLNPPRQVPSAVYAKGKF